MPTIFYTFAAFFNLTKAFDIVDQWKVKIKEVLKSQASQSF